MLEQEIKNVIRDVPNFPIEGIIFKDITPIMMNPALSQKIIDRLYDLYKDKNIDKVAGIESRGFLFGYPLAIKLGVPFILIRKKGKLPYKKTSFDYNLEYGSATIEIHTDAIEKGENILIHDDLLATGGSAGAAAELVKLCGGNVAGFNFLVGLNFLDGDKKLNAYSENIVSLVNY
ncbi:MAG: adenine phosphoribosyltransferase [Bacteroidota bacterium]